MKHVLICSVLALAMLGCGGEAEFDGNAADEAQSSSLTARGPTALRRRLYEADHQMGTAVCAPFVSVSGRRVVCNNEGVMGTSAPVAAVGSHPVYQCLAFGWDQFQSRRADCEGQRRLGEAYYFWDGPGPGRRAIYRCDAHDHFVSPDSRCEGWRSEGLLGYLSY